MAFYTHLTRLSNRKGLIFVFTWSYLIHTSFSTNQIFLDNGRMLVSWSFDAVADKYHFKVNATATGWIGFGFAPLAPNAMTDYDVIMGGYKDGQGYIYDLYAIGQQPPPVDASQDYNLTMVAEEDGRTILHIERARNTGDVKDIQFEDNTEVYFVWALHSSGDATSQTVFPFHERKGSSGSKQMIGRGIVSQATFVTSSTHVHLTPSPSMNSPSVYNAQQQNSPNPTAPKQTMITSSSPKMFATTLIHVDQTHSPNTSSPSVHSKPQNSTNVADPIRTMATSHTMFVNPSTHILLPSPSIKSAVASATQNPTATSNPDSDSGAAQDDGPNKDEGKDKKNWLIIILLSASLSLLVLSLLLLGCFWCFVFKRK